jgi:hypothetical protein
MVTAASLEESRVVRHRFAHYRVVTVAHSLVQDHGKLSKHGGRELLAAFDADVSPHWEDGQLGSYFWPVTNRWAYDLRKTI